MTKNVELAGEWGGKCRRHRRQIRELETLTALLDGPDGWGAVIGAGSLQRYLIGSRLRVRDYAWAYSRLLIEHPGERPLMIERFRSAYSRPHPITGSTWGTWEDRTSIGQVIAGRFERRQVYQAEAKS